jgi:hypothetical protein
MNDSGFIATQIVLNVGKFTAPRESPRLYSYKWNWRMPPIYDELALLLADPSNELWEFRGSYIYQAGSIVPFFLL